MDLIAFHRFLIACGILFCAGYAAWEIRKFFAGGRASSLLIALVFAALTAGLGYYLANLKRFLGRSQD